jgi:3-isopropylmalate/(R)-2-methylmalate dehydratase small subunit
VKRKPISTVRSPFVFLPKNDVDTDQIIPARFLKTTSRESLGVNAFHDWRYAPDGSLSPAFPLNSPRAAGASILVAGENFGCGSSREHAAWALAGLGLQAVIALSFADIFRANAIQNGLLPVVVSRSGWEILRASEVTSEAAGVANPEVRIDLTTQTVVLPGQTTEHFAIDAFAKRCLLDGTDTLGYLLAQGDLIAAYERAHPSLITTIEQ